MTNGVPVGSESPHPPSYNDSGHSPWRGFPFAPLGILIVLALLCPVAMGIVRERRKPDTNPVADGNATLQDLRRDLPERDLVQQAVRFGLIAPESIDSLRTLAEPRPTDTVGDVESFFVHDIINERFLEVEARLELLTDVAAFWVQVGQPFDADALDRGGERFSQHVYPGLREAFGEEWSPGVDGDPRIHVLHHEPVPGIAGFFSSADEMTQNIDPNSNAREMFYINLSVFQPGTDDYLALLAHEFQHMIHWRADRGEPTWVNEGLSELAPHLVGYGSQRGASFLSDPDLQLTRWEPTSQTNSAHYAASYLFMAYLQDRFGEPMLRALVEAPENGALGIEAAAASFPSRLPEGGSTANDAGEDEPTTFDELFLDWAVANALGDAAREGDDGRWSYQRSLPRVVHPEVLNDRGKQTDVSQHATDYWDVTPHVSGGQLALRFEGASAVGLLEPLDQDPAFAAGDGYPDPPDNVDGSGDGSTDDAGGSGYTSGSSDDGYPAPSDTSNEEDREPAVEGRDVGEIGAAGNASNGSEHRVWWSGRADGMHSRLERTVDLSDADAASLELTLWYELEENWDYAYYTASVDGGHTWQPLASTLTTPADPNGNNIGDGITGRSDGWETDIVDLTSLVGGPVMLGIEVITDDAVSLAGMAVREPHVLLSGGERGRNGDGNDNVTLASEGDWSPVGWLDIDPRLPQLWGLQLIIDDGERIRVQRFDANLVGQAAIDVVDIPPDATLTLLVSGLTPATRNPATYALRIIEPETAAP